MRGNRKVNSTYMLLISFLLLFLYNTSFCSVNQKELSRMDSKYIIDLDGKQETSVPFSTYFENAKSIILETNKDCLISDIIDIQVFDGYIYLLDIRGAKSLFVFDMDGYFIRKIGRLGNGPGEYISLSNFTLDTKNKFIYLLDYFKRIHKYKLDGTFIHTITPKLKDENIMHIQYFNSKLYLSVMAFKPSQNDYMLLEANADNGEILSKSLPLKYNKGWAELIFMGYNFFIPRLNNIPLYTQMFMDYIFCIGDDIIPYIEIRSKNLVTDKDVSNISNIRGGRDMIERFQAYFRDNLKIFNIHSYIENDELILFMYQQGLMNSYFAVANKKTGSVKLAKQLSNDIIFKSDDNHYFGGFAFYDTKGAYEILQTRSIEDFQESIRNNKVVPGLDKLDELLSLELDANPVIFYYEYK